MSALSRVVSI